MSRHVNHGGPAALAAVHVELAAMLAAVGPVAASLTPPKSLYQDVPARLFGNAFIPVALGGRDRVFVRSVYLLEDERVRLRTLIAGQQAAGRARHAEAVA